MTALTRYEVMFWVLASVCALAALAWLVNSLETWVARLVTRARANADAAGVDAAKPVPYTLTPAGEDAITWERGGTIDVDLAAFREHQNIWPVRVRVGQPGCTGIPCIWFDDGTWSPPCGAHDTRIAARRAAREQRMAARLIADIEQELKNT